MRPLLLTAPFAVLGLAGLAGLAVALAVAATPVAAQVPDEPAGATTAHYVALGDSLAAGYGAARGYVPVYADHLQAGTGAGATLRNLGRGGWTSADLLHALTTDPAVRAAAAGAAVLTWNIGGNDLLAARYRYKAGACGGADRQDCLRAAADGLKANWDGILRELLALRGASGAVGTGTDSGLRTMDVYNPYVAQDVADGSLAVFRGYLDDVNAHLAAAAGASGIPHVAVYRAFNGPGGNEDPAAKGYISADGLHPSDAGHAAIADLLRALGSEDPPLD